MRRRITSATRLMRIAGALLLLHAVLLPGIAPASAQVSEQELIARYAPSYLAQLPPEPCATGNGHLPIAVGAVLRDPAVRLLDAQGQQVATAPGPDGLGVAADGVIDLPGVPETNGCDARRWEQQLVARGAKHVVYGRVVRDPNAPAVLYVQYWAFLIANDWWTPQEGDWEMVQVEFTAPDATTAAAQGPQTLTVAQHAVAQSVRWTDVMKREQTHPVVHLARGSNAAQIERGVFLRTLDGCDVTVDAADSIDVEVVPIPSDDTRARAVMPWLTFRGRWGAADDGLSGPPGPAFQEQWNAPWQWARTATRPRARIPARGLARTTAATACALAVPVARLGRSLPRPPAAALWAASILLALAAILLGRMRWRRARRRGYSPVALSSAAAVVVAIGAAGGLAHWLADLLSDGPVSALLDSSVAVIGVLGGVLGGVLLVSAAGLGALAGMPRKLAVSAPLMHPLRAFARSPHGRSRGRVTAMIVVCAVGLVLARFAAVAIVVAGGLQMWLVLPIAAVLDVLVVGAALVAIATGPPPTSGAALGPVQSTDA